ncbi:MAG: ComF family protein [Candidatus Thiodiazotropha sp. (ex Ctena orbiculata)]|nr:ComF family protein [Candidatus Thiodiazotropha taylori]MBT2996397.1 ComF family protein [Candidatus Thiodiazotropha taylori]MBT3000169.1 ComF family protein [Candidatus Thiodiazotropha taylori]MBT3028233.1 ComF family protein [Candidatus Thiodiazotropha taylori]MBT3036065.1 ComF family protein [Candidatus Thiodiazotropha taylori]
MKVNNCIHFIQNLLYPRDCLLCGAAGDFEHHLCPPCQRRLPFNLHACPGCALPLPPEVPASQLCGRCIRRSAEITRTITAMTYQPPVNRLIGMLKFHNRLHLVEPLAGLLIERLGEDYDRPDLLIPVPLHPVRLRERGFNQSVEIARVLARRCGLSHDWRLCRRIKHTPPQAELKREARRKNLHRAFEICADLSGSHLVVVDDVITTGATVAELGRLLKKAGAKRVDAWALARTSIS